MKILLTLLICFIITSCSFLPVIQDLREYDDPLREIASRSPSKQIVVMFPIKRHKKDYSLFLYDFVTICGWIRDDWMYQINQTKCTYDCIEIPMYMSDIWTYKIKDDCLKQTALPVDPGNWIRTN